MSQTPEEWDRVPSIVPATAAFAMSPADGRRHEIAQRLLQLLRQDMEHKGTFKLDTGKKPKQIDVTPTDGPEKDKVLEGIYELAKDELKICIGHDSGAARPKEFESKEGSHHLLVKLKREK